MVVDGHHKSHNELAARGHYGPGKSFRVKIGGEVRYEWRKHLDAEILRFGTALVNGLSMDR